MRSISQWCALVAVCAMSSACEPVLGLGDSGPEVDAGSMCPPGLEDCDGDCRDLSVDPSHCGACGTACDPGEVCSGGSCELTCMDGLTECGGSCRDLMSDRAHCGGCGDACDAGEVCSAGVCALSCMDGLTECSGSCRDVMTDRAHCGGCGDACDAGEVCSAGVCALSCMDGLTECSGSCRDLMTDRAHCGGCGDACDDGEVCAGGTCSVSCPSGQTECGGRCVDTAVDRDHCGACDMACDLDRVCAASACVAPVDLQILSFSDWHAQLDPTGTPAVGGAAVLSAYFTQERAANPNTIVVTGGDAFGGSPPLSGYFGEEPAVRALNLMGLTADTFGNHNFDRGIAPLQGLIDLASYEYVSSNLGNLAANLTGVRSPFHIVRVGGVDVALIGITNPDAPSLTAPGALGTLTVDEPIASAMAARDMARAAGAEVVIALVHMGATGFDAGTRTYSGPLIDFANGLSGFHAVIGDHTNFEVNTVIRGAVVVENRSQGRTYARVVLRVHPATGEVLSRSTTIVTPLASGVTPDPAIESMLAPFRMMLAAVMDARIGVATDVFVRGSNIERLQEVPIGNLLADAMRLRYGTQIAFTNGGGIRAPLPSSYAPADTTLRRTSPGYAAGPPYDLVRGDAYAVLPFGNVVVTRTVTGTQLWDLLEHGLSALPAANGRFPQVSGIRLRYSASAPAGSRITSLTLTDGTPIARDATTYTLATNDFVNAGGDGYTVLADGTGTTRDVMADILAAHIETAGTITPMTDGRITADP